MRKPQPPPSVQVELEIRATFPGAPGQLARILRTLRRSGGALRAHLVYRLYDRSEGFFLCEKPAEAALALRNEGVKVETETVVAVRCPNRPGTFSHLVQTLEADKIEIVYSYSTAVDPELLVVFRTPDNPRAEDVLRGYLVREDRSVHGPESDDSGARRQPAKRSS